MRTTLQFSPGHWSLNGEWTKKKEGPSCTKAMQKQLKHLQSQLATKKYVLK
jgi:hypothetical protein